MVGSVASTPSLLGGQPPAAARHRIEHRAHARPEPAIIRSMPVDSCRQTGAAAEAATLYAFA